jgi:hypothetical protein
MCCSIPYWSTPVLEYPISIHLYDIYSENLKEYICTSAVVAMYVRGKLSTRLPSEIEMTMGKKRQRQDPVQEIYQEVTSIAPRPSTGLPGTPHSFFASSYDVQVLSSTIVVHGHANGLCIVCLNQVPASNVKSIDYLVTAAPDCSAAERRKRQATLLKKGIQSKTAIHGIVLPTTILANLVLEDGTIQPIHAGVWGTIVELNDNMSPELLRRDPLLDGYLAIIQPATGAFPPRTLDLLRGDEGGNKKTCNDDDRDD